MPNRRSFSSTPLHPDTVDWQSRVNAVGGRIAKKTLMHTDRLIKYCYSVGLRDITGASHKLKFWLPLATDGFEGLFVPIWHPTANAICVNNNFVAADYSLSNGMGGNGVDKYIDSLVNANLFANSIYLATHSSTDSSVISTAMGIFYFPFFSGVTIRYGDNNSYFGHREANALAAPTTNSIGFFAGIRTNQNNYFYQNSALLGTNTTPDNSNTIPNLTHYLFARNENNNPGAFSARRLCCFFIGDNITPAQHEAFAPQQMIWDTAVRA